MRLALAQLNPTIGDLRGNAALIVDAIARARGAGCDLVATPELAICGYPPKDLLLHEGFVEEAERAARRIGAEGSAGITVVIGTPLRCGGEGKGRGVGGVDGVGGAIANGLVVYRDGVCVATYHKRLLPTYDVFDEDRYFEPGDQAVVIEVPVGEGKMMRVGLAICEDLWRGQDAGFSGRYAGAADPVEALVREGAEVLVVPSASPFVLGKGARHREILSGHAARHGVWVASVNQVGGNDDLIFDGHAAVYAPGGVLLAAAEGFREELLIAEVGEEEGGGGERTNVIDPEGSREPEGVLLDALVLGVRDYCRKTGFARAVLGVSGGIDSALVAAIGALALGPERVLGVAMPGPYSSAHSVADARELCERLGIGYVEMPISDGFDATGKTLDGVFDAIGEKALGAVLPDLTEENLQSRLRGTMIMAISNRTGAIVLTTGNKSEMAVGYCTLYGDMNGGLAVLSDVTKGFVYALSRYINRAHAALGFATAPIPESTLAKPPSAELRPDQKDQDSLPEYDVLDAIIERYVERREDPARIVRETGFDAEVVARIVRLIDLSEYKRKQAAVGLKVTSVAFGTGRRWPIAMRRTGM